MLVRNVLQSTLQAAITLCISLVILPSCSKPSTGVQLESDHANALRTMEDLYNNDGKMCTIRGRLSTHPEQHPTGLHDEWDDDPHAEIKRKVQTYVELLDDEGWQIVLTSDTKIDCPGIIRVTGEVDVVKPKAKVGKNSYGRPWVRVKNYECE